MVDISEDFLNSFVTHLQNNSDDLAASVLHTHPPLLARIQALLDRAQSSQFQNRFEISEKIRVWIETIKEYCEEAQFEEEFLKKIKKACKVARNCLSKMMFDEAIQSLSIILEIDSVKTIELSNDLFSILVSNGVDSFSDCGGYVWFVEIFRKRPCILLIHRCLELNLELSSSYSGTLFNIIPSLIVSSQHLDKLFLRFICNFFMLLFRDFPDKLCSIFLDCINPLVFELKNESNICNVRFSFLTELLHIFLTVMFCSVRLEFIKDSVKRSFDNCDSFDVKCLHEISRSIVLTKGSSRFYDGMDANYSSLKDLFRYYRQKISELSSLLIFVSFPECIAKEIKLILKNLKIHNFKMRKILELGWNPILSCRKLLSFSMRSNSKLENLFAQFFSDCFSAFKFSEVSFTNDSFNESELNNFDVISELISLFTVFLNSSFYSDLEDSSLCLVNCQELLLNSVNSWLLIWRPSKISPVGGLIFSLLNSCNNLILNHFSNFDSPCTLETCLNHHLELDFQICSKLSFSSAKFTIKLVHIFTHCLDYLRVILPFLLNLDLREFKNALDDLNPIIEELGSLFVAIFRLKSLTFINVERVNLLFMQEFDISSLVELFSKLEILGSENLQSFFVSKINFESKFYSPAVVQYFCALICQSFVGILSKENLTIGANNSTDKLRFDALIGMSKYCENYLTLHDPQVNRNVFGKLCKYFPVMNSQNYEQVYCVPDSDNSLSRVGNVASKLFLSSVLIITNNESSTKSTINRKTLDRLKVAMDSALCLLAYTISENFDVETSPVLLIESLVSYLRYCCRVKISTVDGVLHALTALRKFLVLTHEVSKIRKSNKKSTLLHLACHINKSCDCDWVSSNWWNSIISKFNLLNVLSAYVYLDIKNSVSISTNVLSFLESEAILDKEIQEEIESEKFETDSIQSLDEDITKISVDESERSETFSVTSVESVNSNHDSLDDSMIDNDSRINCQEEASLSLMLLIPYIQLKIPETISLVDDSEINDRKFKKQRVTSSKYFKKTNLWNFLNLDLLKVVFSFLNGPELYHCTTLSRISLFASASVSFDVRLLLLNFVKRACKFLTFRMSSFDETDVDQISLHAPLCIPLFQFVLSTGDLRFTKFAGGADWIRNMFEYFGIAVKYYQQFVSNNNIIIAKKKVIYDDED